MRLIAAKALISNAFVASESLFAIHFHQQLLFCVTIATIWCDLIARLFFVTLPQIISAISFLIMDNLPQDPAMLFSFINMKLRDEYPRSTSCVHRSTSTASFEEKLNAAGWEYNPEANKFW